MLSDMGGIENLASLALATGSRLKQHSYHGGFPEGLDNYGCRNILTAFGCGNPLPV